MLFIPLVYTTQHSCWLVHITSWASPTHFIPWASLTYFILSYFLHSYGLSLIFWASPAQLPHLLPLGLLAFEPISITNSFLWAVLVCFCFLSISYDSYGLTTSFFEAPLGPFAFFGAFLLFCKPVDHYSCHSCHFGSMVFTLLFSFSISFILLGFFYHWALLPKMSVNKEWII